MKFQLGLSLAISLMLLAAVSIFVVSVQAQDTVRPEPIIEILEESPESVFVFDISPDTAQVGQYPIFVMYAWGYLGDPTQALTITTTIPAGVDIGGCPEGCVREMHILRDPYGGAGISATLNATATLVGQHVLVAFFQDDMGVSQTLSATITVVEPPPTAVGLTRMSAHSAEPQTNWTLLAIALFVCAILGMVARRRVHVNN